MAARALDDLRVLDFSTSFSGAWCSRLLADFGADVVMLDPPGGHPLRMIGPRGEDGMGALETYLLANKRSIDCDIENPRDRLRATELARSADLVVSSASLARLEQFDLTYEAMHRPSLIMAHITPYGMAGPDSGLPGNDLSVAARSGWASINGQADREPLKPSGWQTSYVAGTAAFAGVLAALHHRDMHPGEGQEVDIAELDAMVAAFAPALLRGQYQDVLHRRTETDMTNGPVPVADGHFALTISRAHFWRNAMTLLGLLDLADDPRWESSSYRQAHHHEYVGRVQERMHQWKRMDLFAELAARRVVAGPVLTMEELESNEHLRARGFWTRPSANPAGPEYPGAPFRMSATPWALDREAPRIGEHTEILGWPPATPGEAPAPNAGPKTAGEGRNAGPLSGIRGIVLTQAWAGSFCTELLGLLGADIVQVEVCKRLDSWRGGYDGQLATALRDSATAKHPWNCNFLYNSVNLNKRCITLDLQTQAGLEVFRRLIRQADFVAENFSPRVLGNLGIDYEAMTSLRPDIILCSLSAYGHDGPWANVPGIGGTIEPTSGMSSLLGYVDGPPLNSGQMYPDAVAGIYGCAAILTALHHRNRHGQGQYIDLSMQEANLTFVGDAAVEFLRTGLQRARRGNRHPDFAPHGIYACSGDDQWLALACESEAQWQGLCRVAGQPEWLADQRFVNSAARKAAEDALDGAIGAWTRGRERDSLVALLTGAGVIAAPVLDAREVAEDVHLRDRGMVAAVNHAEAGTWLQAGNPLRFSRTPATSVRAAPLLGEHTWEVLSELLGMSFAEYEALVAAGVSGTGPPGEGATTS